VVVAVLTLLFFIRSVRVAGELASRGGNPTRRELNRARERRGF
jgi:hypothetical protein